MPTPNRTGKAAVMNPAPRGIEPDSGPAQADTIRPAIRADYALADSSVRKANNPEMARPRLK